MSWERASRTLTLASVFVLATASDVAAQTSEKAVAEALFQDARTLLANGDVSAACIKFAASQRIEPKLGTLLNLAACHETEGHTASAWAEFTEASTRATHAGENDRAAYATKHAAALEQRLSRLVLRAPASTPLFEILLDGVRLDSAELGTPIPVDPGEHAIVAQASGKTSWNDRVNIPLGPSSTELTIPELKDAPAQSPTVEKAPIAAPIASAPPIHRTASSSRRAATFAALTVGVTAIGIGTYNGVRAFNKKADAAPDCDGLACSQAGLDLYNEAKSSATVATVAYGIGILGLVAGVYLIVTSRDPAPMDIGLGKVEVRW